MKRSRQKKRRSYYQLSTLLLIQFLLLAPGAHAASESGARETSPEPASDKSQKAGAGTADAISPDKINKVLATEDVYGEQFKVSSFIQGNEVTVQTWTNPRSRDPEHDYKINAVLIAKKLMDAFPDSIKVCKVRYFDRQDFKKYTEFTIVPGVVKSFAAGIMSEADLLTTIPMTYVGGETAPAAGSAGGTSLTGSAPAGSTETGAAQGTTGAQTQAAKTPGGVTNIAALPATTVNSAPANPTPANPTTASTAVPKAAPIDPNSIVTVLSGPLVNERAALLSRVKALEAKGTRSPEIRKMFAVMEGLIRDEKTDEAQTLMASISKSVTDLENNLKRAQAVKHSAGGPITVRTGSPGSSGASSGSRPGSAGSGASGGAGGNDFEVGLAIIKRKMGDFYPHYGPLYLDRYNIGNALFMMQSSGKNVEAYRQPFLQMEAMVISGGSGLEQSIKKLNGQLHLADAVRDEEYQFQQKLADERKGMDLK